jgi:hypothetical protein
LRYLTVFTNVVVACGFPVLLATVQFVPAAFITHPWKLQADVDIDVHVEHGLLCVTSAREL